MALKGEAKTGYMREYMRKRRAEAKGGEVKGLTKGLTPHLEPGEAISYMINQVGLEVAAIGFTPMKTLAEAAVRYIHALEEDEALDEDLDALHSAYIEAFDSVTEFMQEWGWLVCPPPIDDHEK